MKILFYLNRYPAFGGIENITTTLAKAFTDKLNYRVGVFSYIQDESLRVNTPSGVQYFYAEQYDNKGIAFFIDAVKEFDPDVVIFQDSYAPIESPLIELKKISRFKLIVIEHNTPDCHILEYRLRWKQHSWFVPKQAAKKLLFPYIYSKMKRAIGNRHKLLIEASDAYILLSDSYKQILKYYWKIDNSKLLAIPNIKNDFAIKSSNEIGDKKKTVLFVGRLTEQKGIKYLIDIWAKIEPLAPDWTLKILGDGELKHYVINQIKSKGLSRIELLGFKSNVEDYYKESSAIFLSSIYEGFGLVLPEAMQFGVIPFVFDSYSAVHDIVDEDCGFIVKPFDTNRYAEQFLSFTQFDSKRIESMRKKAVAKSNRFSEEHILERWRNLIEK